MKNTKLSRIKIVYKNLLFFIFILAGFHLSAQQAEIAVSSHVDVKLFSKKEIEKYKTTSDNPREAEIIKKEDAVKRMFRDQIKASYFEIVKRLGENQDVRFVKEYNPATTNFILHILFSIMIDEIPMDVVNKDVKLDDGSYVHGIYFMRVIFRLDDPHTNTIVTMAPNYKTKFKSSNYLSAEYLFNKFWLSFLNTAIPRSNADAMRELIKEKIRYKEGAIRYIPNDNEKPKADGKQQGFVIVKIPYIVGEARNRSITQYVLRCEKGTFLSNGTKEFKFSGADYFYEKYGGNRKIKVKYRAYNCKDYDKEKRGYDTFTLIEQQELQESTEHTVVEKKVNFQCEKTYDVYAYYNAPGFLKVGVVWRNATIRFPEEGQKPQVFDVMAYEKAGGQGEPVGTDGKPLAIPYSMTLPMIGKQTFYGHPENEYETPQILYAKSLGEIPAFRLNKKHDALNSCHLVSTNGGPVHLELSIDMEAGSDGEYPEQFRIYCDNTLSHMNLPAFPINFKVIRFTEDDIGHFKKFEKVEKTVSNGKATLRVLFLPEKSH
ncbi:hypothetical protein LA303_03265 [Candidatus Sulfidibacterium hydrothermale]|uniref:hypothetical protein n=1 Tax=Candidatus Sulfidibacterium hydrothermale TaxID=2875962 RepID=UPI001F0A207E|nr:hypothetical protein [Candidatus Sulfidibacterium hydrothermale]UBM63005.1 hypothetical protein LA303_03265 [Candidatus Sulfidibacterium hydrothermale]